MDLKHKHASPLWLAIATLTAGLAVAACDRPANTSSTTTTPSGTATTPSNTASSNAARSGSSAMAPSESSKASTTASSTPSAAKGADDATITTQVKSAIAADANLKSQQISVDTKDQTVTLAGNVESSAQKDRAKEIATGVTGVKRVNDDNLKVKAS
jgi:hyperosmotically inducible periplasmic protein